MSQARSADPWSSRALHWIVAHRVVLTTGVVYVLLVLTMWGHRGPMTGMRDEATAVVQNATRPLLNAFELPARTRERAGIPYEVAYLLGAALTVPGDFTMYQVVYAAIWWARGFLTFLIIRRLFRGRDFFAYLAGALVLVHGSDEALTAVAMTPIVGMFVWMLLSFYLFIAALQSTTDRRRVLLGAGACFAAYMTLWSYESELLIVVCFPAFALWIDGRRDRPRLGLAAAYWLVAVTYVVREWTFYTDTHGTYQQSLLRTDLSVGALVSDLGFQMSASLKFWEWPFHHGAIDPFEPRLMGAVAAVVVVLGAVVLERQVGSQDDPSTRRGYRSWMLVASLMGLALCALSFPAFLVLSVSRSLWRTQALSGFGTAVLFAALLCLLPRVRPLRLRLATLLPSLGAAVIVFCGVDTAVQAGIVRYWEWEHHRAAVAQVLQLVPDVQDETVVVLVDVPRQSDPFYEDMWFDAALQLAYPDVKVTGAYYYRPGAEPLTRRNPVELVDGQWRQNPEEPFRPLVKDVPFANTVIVQYREDGAFRLLSDVPPELTQDPAVVASYRPAERIASNVPSPQARRMYLRWAPWLQ